MARSLDSQDSQRYRDKIALMIKFGKNLRRLRSERGLTQNELADRMGVRPASICAMECGQANATLSTVSRLAAALDVDASEFLREVGA